MVARDLNTAPGLAPGAGEGPGCKQVIPFSDLQYIIFLKSSCSQPTSKFIPFVEVKENGIAQFQLKSMALREGNPCPTTARGAEVLISCEKKMSSALQMPCAAMYHPWT